MNEIERDGMKRDESRRVVTPATRSRGRLTLNEERRGM
jgi:hypothetical protein